MHSGRARGARRVAAKMRRRARKGKSEARERSQAKAAARQGKKRESGGFCCQAPPSPALKCYPQGLEPSTFTALRGYGHRSIVVVGNYKVDPMTVVSCRAKNQPLHPRRSYFAPAATRWEQRAGVEAPGTAPGSERLITLAVYRHSRDGSLRRDGINIDARARFARAGSTPFHALRRLDKHQARRDAARSDEGEGS